MAPSRRAQKLAEVVREVVSMAILRELKDPRVRDVTVTYVEVSGDLRLAKVHVSVMGPQTQQELSLRGLESAAGFLQSKIRQRVETRYIPKLVFQLDQGVKKSIAVAQILKQVLPAPPAGPETGAADEQPTENQPPDPLQGTSEDSEPDRS